MFLEIISIFEKKRELRDLLPSFVLYSILGAILYLFLGSYLNIAHASVVTLILLFLSFHYMNKAFKFLYKKWAESVLSQDITYVLKEIIFVLKQPLPKIKNKLRKKVKDDGIYKAFRNYVLIGFFLSALGVSFYFFVLIKYFTFLSSNSINAPSWNEISMLITTLVLFYLFDYHRDDRKYHPSYPIQEVQSILFKTALEMTFDPCEIIKKVKEERTNFLIKLFYHFFYILSTILPKIDKNFGLRIITHYRGYPIYGGKKDINRALKEYEKKILGHFFKRNSENNFQQNKNRIIEEGNNIENIIVFESIEEYIEKEDKMYVTPEDFAELYRKIIKNLKNSRKSSKDDDIWFLKVIPFNIKLYEKSRDKISFREEKKENEKIGFGLIHIFRRKIPYVEFFPERTKVAIPGKIYENYFHLVIWCVVKKEFYEEVAKEIYII